MNSSENSLGLVKRLPIPRRDAGGSFQVFCLLSPPNVDGIGDRSLQNCPPGIKDITCDQQKGTIPHRHWSLPVE
jgi:hypothetical protein